MALARCGALMFAVGALVLGAVCACGQQYPLKPIRMVTAEAGGGNDFVARLLAPGLAESLGQTAFVDNRGGAGGIIAADIVAKASPDGHTLLVYASNIWIIPLLRRDVPYDFDNDFSPITWAARSPSTLVVHPALPVRSVQDLIALARARPGALNYGSGGTGATAHVAAELFKSMAGVDIVRISYKGNAPALTDLLAGQLQLVFATAGAVAPYVRAGRLRALAVTSAQPSALAPGLPTVAASGLPGYESISIYGLFAPARTPAAIIARLNYEVVRILYRADIKEKFLASGVEPVGSTAAEFAAAINADVARMGKVIRNAGIRAE